MSDDWFYWARRRTLRKTVSSFRWMARHLFETLKVLGSIGILIAVYNLYQGEQKKRDTDLESAKIQLGIRNENTSAIKTVVEAGHPLDYADLSYSDAKIIDGRFRGTCINAQLSRLTLEIERFSAIRSNFYHASIRFNHMDRKEKTNFHMNSVVAQGLRAKINGNVRVNIYNSNLIRSDWTLKNGFPVEQFKIQDSVLDGAKFTFDSSKNIEAFAVHLPQKNCVLDFNNQPQVFFYAEGADQKTSMPPLTIPQCEPAVANETPVAILGTIVNEKEQTCPISTLATTPL